MRDPQLIGFIFLLSVTVVAAYFYLKRAQRRPAVTKTDGPASAESGSASSWDEPAGNQPMSPSTATAEQARVTERGT